MSYNFILYNLCFNIIRIANNCIGHILRTNCLLRQDIEGKINGGIEVTGIRWRRRRKLLDDLEERKWYSLPKKGALDRTMWTASFGRGFGPVVRQTNKWMSKFKKGPLRILMYLSLYGFYWHVWGWPKYRAKHVAHM
jgi:hypothetical protein